MFRSNESRLAIFLFVMALAMVGAGCSDDDPITPTPPTEDDPYALSLSRHDWFWASSPFLGEHDPDQRIFDPETRVEAVRWFKPKDRVLSRHLNPELINEERDETQPAIQLYLRSDDGTWDTEDWGGITQGLHLTGLDLSETQYFELWVNDGQPDMTLRSGKLHVDFGRISEDGFWPIDGDGNLVVGKYEFEDANEDGVFNALDEDLGLDGNENGPQRYDTSYELNGDSPFPHINGTARNNREDDEDINGNGRFDRDNAFFTLTIDLKDTEAHIDVVYDYDDVDELVNEGISWRKYRIPLDKQDSYSDRTLPNLEDVTHVRLWFEDDGPGAPSTRSFQFSDLKFVIPD